MAGSKLLDIIYFYFLKNILKKLSKKADNYQMDSFFNVYKMGAAGEAEIKSWRALQ